jgi:cytochrome c biogenesis protein CcmG, thiol:disulfide interchange protein DsbE
MDTYYTLLDIPAHATAAEVDAAYRRQRERYSPERVAALGEEFRQVAEGRLGELDRAYAALSDTERRREYDARIGLAGPPVRAPRKGRGLSRREIVMAACGALAGLLVIAIAWSLSGQSVTNTRLNAAEQNRPAPGFVLPALSGSDVRLEDYRGKVVLLNFWYTGCEPCREETPALQAAYKQLSSQGLEIIGVNVRRNERAGADGDADIRKFIADHGVTYPIALDGDNATNRDYQVYVLPTSVMIDRDGRIRYLMFSAVTTQDVEALFNKLQQETAAVSSRQSASAPRSGQPNDTRR